MIDSRQPSAREPFAHEEIAIRSGHLDINDRVEKVGSGRGAQADSRSAESPSPRNWDIEEGTATKGDPDSCESKVFPARPFKCLPFQIRICIPKTWQEIQDATHLILVLGTACALGLLVAELALIISSHGRGSKFFHKEILCIIMISLNAGYLIQVISSYDESMRVREKTIASRKKDLVDEYENLVEGIDELLGKATQSSAALAESGFESKRRDFIRFLERAEGRAHTMVTTTDVDHRQLVEQFKGFVKHWLAVFSECSVDPMNAPKNVVTDAELAKFQTIPEVTMLVKERLKNAEVRFFSKVHDEDVKELRGFKQTQRRLSEKHTGQAVRKVMSTVPGGGEIELTHHTRSERGRPEQNRMQDLSSIRSGMSAYRPPQQPGSSSRFAIPCNWCLFGSFPCGVKSQGAGGWTLSCWFGQLTVLSTEHLGLLLGLLLGVAVTILVVFNSIDDNRSDFHWLLLPLWGYLLAVIVMLVRFEQLDIIQKLERELGELQQEKEKLVGRREEMVRFWNDMQQLTDIWVCRTTPRLDLLKEIHCSLEDVKKPEELYKSLQDTNCRLQEMESRLPELSMWRRNSLIGEDAKKRFAQQVKSVYCRADQNLPTILSGVGKLCQDDIPRLRVENEDSA